MFFKKDKPKSSYDLPEEIAALVEGIDEEKGMKLAEILGGYGEEREFGSRMRKSVSPHMDYLRNHPRNKDKEFPGEDEYFGKLIQLDQMYLDKPDDLISMLIESVKGPGHMVAKQEFIDRLEKIIDVLESVAHERQASDTDSFLEGLKPDMPLVDDEMVLEMMNKLLDSGIAVDIKDAYDKSCKLLGKEYSEPMAKEGMADVEVEVVAEEMPMDEEYEEEMMEEEVPKIKDGVKSSLTAITGGKKAKGNYKDNLKELKKNARS